MREIIKTMIDTSLHNRVVFIDPRPHQEVATWLRASRMLVAPSHLEAFGLTVTEAIQCHTPVIFTSRTCGPELIDHGKTGLLVDPEHPLEISAAVASILANPQAALTMTNHALQTASQRFSLDHCVDQTISVYSSLL